MISKAEKPHAAACPSPASIRVRVGTSFAAPDSARLGRWYLDRELFPCAVEAFRTAVASEPHTSEFLYLLGLSFEREGQVAEAIGPLREAARLSPADPSPHLIIGRILDLQQRRPEAEAEWRAALTMNPALKEALDHLSDDLLRDKDYLGVITLLASSGDKGDFTQVQMLDLGEALALTARMNEAIAVLQGGLKRYENSASLADELATVQMLAGKQKEADETLKEFLRTHPGDPGTEVLYLRSLISGKSTGAETVADQLVAAHPQNAEILYLAADLAWSKGESAKAEVLIVRSLTASDADYKAQQLYAAILMQKGDINDARQHFERAIAEGDLEPDIFYQLARVQTKLGDAGAAEASLQRYRALRAISKGRIDTAEDVARGDQAMQDGDPAGAIGFFHQALELSPSEALLHYKLSRALDQMHDIAGEWVELERAVHLDSTFAEALNQMGFIKAHEGDPQEAEDFFLRATKASPTYIVALTNLAATYASEAKWERAGYAVDAALRLDPSNSTANRIKASIATSRSTP